jgi:hypothetical protein
MLGIEERLTGDSGPRRVIRNIATSRINARVAQSAVNISSSPQGCNRTLHLLTSAAWLSVYPRGRRSMTSSASRIMSRTIRAAGLTYPTCKALPTPSPPRGHRRQVTREAILNGRLAPFPRVQGKAGIGGKPAAHPPTCLLLHQGGGHGQRRATCPSKPEPGAYAPRGSRVRAGVKRRHRVLSAGTPG